MCCPSRQSEPTNSVLAVTDDIRAEGESLREHMMVRMERVRRDVHALIDAIEFMKYLGS